MHSPPEPDEQAELAHRLVHSYADSLLRVAMSFLPERAAAQDVVQDVFLRVLSTPPAWKSPAHEKAWLITATCNRCKDLLRSGAHRTRADEALTTARDHNDFAVPTAPSPEHHFITGTAPGANSLADALQQLGPQQRAMVHLFYVEGYNAADIADVLDTTPGAVHTALSRARSFLRTHLQGEHSHAPAQR